MIGFGDLLRSACFVSFGGAFGFWWFARRLLFLSVLRDFPDR